MIMDKFKFKLIKDTANLLAQKHGCDLTKEAQNLIANGLCDSEPAAVITAISSSILHNALAEITLLCHLFDVNEYELSMQGADKEVGDITVAYKKPQTDDELENENN